MARKRIEAVTPVEYAPVSICMMVDGRMLHQAGNELNEPISVADAWALVSAGWVACILDTDLREMRERCDVAGIEAVCEEF